MGVIWCLRRFLTSICILLLIGATTVTKTQRLEKTDHCDPCFKVNTTCYQSEYLFNLCGNFRNNIVIHHLGLFRKDNKLFYSFETEISDPEYFKVGFVTLTNSTECGILSDNNTKFNFGAFDIDQENGIVYLGGSLGVFKLDRDKLEKITFSRKIDNIVAVFYRNGFYFVDEALGNIDFSPISFKEGNSLRTYIESTKPVKMFVIAKDGTVVYLCSVGVMAVRNKELVVLSSYPFFRGLSIDFDGNIFAWWVDGIYKVVLASVFKESKIVKIAHIPNIGSMTFDNGNNILITSANALYRLSPTNSVRC